MEKLIVSPNTPMPHPAPLYEMADDPSALQLKKFEYLNILPPTLMLFLKMQNLMKYKTIAHESHMKNLLYIVQCEMYIKYECKEYE